MNINPGKIPSASLPPSVKGGGNASSKRPASGDPFASVIAQISGADEAGVAGKTPSGSGSRASRKRGTEVLADGESAVSSKHDADDDPMTTNVAIPAWLWAVQDQPKSLGLVPLAQPQTAVGSAGSTGVGGDTLESTGSSDLGTAPRLGALAAFVPGMEAGPASQGATSAGQTAATDPSGSSAASTVVGPFGEPSNPGLPAGVTGVQPGVGNTSPIPGSFAPTDPLPGSAPSETPASQTLASASTDQPGATQSMAPARRVGRGPAAYADAANAAGLRPAGQAANGVATSTASSSQAGPGRVAGNLRTSMDRANGGAARAGSTPPVLADGQFSLADALLAGRAQGGKADSSGQDSAHSSPNAQTRAEDLQAPGVQALDASVAQALEAAVGGTAIHADHGVLTSSQAADLGHVSNLDRTTAASAAPLLSGLADRAAALEDANLHRQMVQAIQLQSRNGVGDARITLQPEYLGDVTIALRVEDGGVTAHVSAASTEVREWLGANQSLLRHGLAEQGLTLDRLVVSDEPAEPSRDSRGGNPRQQQSQQDQDQEPRPRPRRDTSTFEITL